MKITKFVVCAGFGILSFTAQAQEKDNSVRIGVDYITNHSSAPNFTSNGPAFLTPQPAGVEVGNATTLVLGYTRRLNANWDAEVVVGVPPKVSANGTGTLESFGTIAHVKEIGPNFFLIYNFGNEENKFRPFVGAGINYTHFMDAEATDSGELASGGPTKISLTNSTGWAFKAGGSYTINRDWSFVAAVAALDVKSDMTTTTGSIERKTTIDFRPIVYTAGFSYHF
jgi:outer membrane protein